MIDHPAPTLIELLAIGALEDEAVIAHCATCDVCADRLAREARLELALGEVQAFRVAQHRKNRRLLVRVAPVLAFAAAAAILVVAMRRSSPPAEVRPDPSAAPTIAVVHPEPPADPAPAPSAALAPPKLFAPPAHSVPPVASATTPSDTDVVIAKLRPRFKACYQESLRTGGPTAGKVVLGVKLDPDGNVLDATVDFNTGFTPEMTTCLVEVLRHARFTGTGKPETLHVPVTFVSQP